ncbi:MAG: hypothetical protein ACC700_18280, partial [Anaerolineales bacterium]
SRKGARPLLRIDQRRAQKLQLASPPSVRTPIIKKALAKCNEVPLPTKVSTTKPEVYPLPAFNYQFMVYVWKVSSSVPRLTFNA